MKSAVYSTAAFQAKQQKTRSHLYDMTVTTYKYPCTAGFSRMSRRHIFLKLMWFIILTIVLFRWTCMAYEKNIFTTSKRSHAFFHGQCRNLSYGIRKLLDVCVIFGLEHFRKKGLIDVTVTSAGPREQ